MQSVKHKQTNKQTQHTKPHKFKLLTIKFNNKFNEQMKKKMENQWWFNWINSSETRTKTVEKMGRVLIETFWIFKIKLKNNKK